MEIPFLTIAELGRAYDRRELSPVEVTRALLDRVKDVAGDGRHERFKSTQFFDGIYHRKQHDLTEKDVQAVRQVLSRHPEILIATPQLQISGLLSNGQVSTIFVGAGRVPSDIQAISSHAVGVIGPEGRGLAASHKKSDALGQGSKEPLEPGAEVGDALTLLGEQLGVRLQDFDRA